MRTSNLRESADSFGNLSLRSDAQGNDLKLKDIATVTDGFAQDPLNTHFNGEPTIIIEVYRTGKQSAITVANAVKDYLDLKRNFSITRGR